jgi:pimeloyl-ACP methyl ester carboxylesterase
MKEKLLRRNGFWLILALALCLVSAIGASIVQTNGGHVTIKDLRWETQSGELESALLFKPDSATADSKAPAIVVAHGWWNNREMQDANYVELARRGYVVISIDMYGHGNSDPLTVGNEAVGGTGMYDAVRLIADLPYVDTAKIGITGHSNGARAANFSIQIDDEATTPLIAAVLLVDNDGIYADADGAYTDIYGTRDAGIVADQYDEFFFRSYDANGVAITAPRDYIGTPNAQSFLHYGVDPTTTSDTRTQDTVYTDGASGAMRVVYTPAQTHPWGPFSKTTTTHVLDFFNESFGAPNPIASGSQVWQVKEGFNLLGLIGFGIFLVAFAKALLFTRAFAGLRYTPTEQLAGTSRKGLAWFWGGLAVSALFSGWSYIILSQTPEVSGVAYNAIDFFLKQGAVYFIALWAAINGVAGLIIMTISYLLFGRRNGQSLRAVGILPGWKKFFHGIGLALVVVIAAFSIVALVDYFFKTDFRIWVIAVKAFTPDKIGIALAYLPFYVVYFFANSIAVNGFNRFTLRGKEWINTAIVALFNSLAPIVLVAVQYITFANTGELVPGFGGIFSIWLFPVIVILAVSAVISRKIYRVTNNPYVGGFINAAVVVLISVTNSLTVT